MSGNLPLGFTAALIAGGKSSRMGRDKRLIEVGGQPLWRRQIELLRSLKPAELVISGPEDGPWKDLPLPAGEGWGEGEYNRVIPDRRPGCGPLAGIAAIFAATRSPLVLMLAVDMPQMPAAFLQSLLDKCTTECGIVPMRGELFEPLAAVYPRSCVALAENQLRSGNYSLQYFVRSCLEARLLVEFKVPPEHEQCFRNLNRPQDIPAPAAGPASADTRS